MRRKRRYLAVGGPIEPTEQAVQGGGDAAGKISSQANLWGMISEVGVAAGDKVQGDQTSVSNNYAGNWLTPTHVNVTEAISKGSTEEILDNVFLGGLLGTSAQRQSDEAIAAKKEEQRRKLGVYTGLGNQRLMNYDSKGSAEEGSIYAYGGSLSKLNSDTVEVNGRTHAQGGVQLPEVDAEVEDDETIAGDYVFSDQLGFADRHKKIAKQIGKVEEKPLNNERRNTLKILRTKEEALKSEQEAVKTLLPDDMRMKAFGGTIDPKDKSNPLNDPKSIWWDDLSLYIDEAGNLKPRPKAPKKIMKIEPETIKADSTRVARPVKKLAGGGPIGLSDYDKEMRTLGVGRPSTVGTPTQFTYSSGVNPSPNLDLAPSSINDDVTDKNRGGSGWGQALNSFAPYVTNVVNALREFPEVPKPMMEQTIAPELVNFDSDRVNLDRELRGANKGVEQASSNPGLANSQKAANFGNYLESRGRLSQSERTTNANIKNNTRQFNSGINFRNVERNNEYQSNLVSRILAEQGFDAENLANASNKMQQQQRDKAMMELENRRLNILPRVYSDTGVYDRNLADLGEKEHYKRGGKFKSKRDSIGSLGKWRY